MTRVNLPAVWRRAGAAALCAGLLLAGAPARAADGSAAEHVVTIEGMRFVPATLAVRRGDRVTWVNKDLVPHTATAQSKAFDSGAIAAGASDGPQRLQGRAEGRAFGHRVADACPPQPAPRLSPHLG